MDLCKRELAVSSDELKAEKYLALGINQTNQDESSRDQMADTKMRVHCLCKAAATMQFDRLSENFQD